jgi:protein-S-isoprenylcysteine O-methyltransferase Ste14
MNTIIIDYRPPRIAQLLVLAAVLLNWLTPMRDWLLWQNLWVGLVLVGAGFVVMIVAWHQFRLDDVAICPTAPTARLITHGIYGYSRNPMYLGMSAMLLGLAVIVGTVPFYLCAVAFFAVMHRRFCPFEETKLERSFGRDFVAYSRRVRRWL